MNANPPIVAALEEIPWFRELKPEHLQRLAAIAKLRDVASGEILFKEGEKEDYLYVVMEGRVALEIYVPHRGRVRIFTAEPMDVVGWSSVTPVVRQRTASARAVLAGKMLALEAESLRRLCDEDHDLGYVIMRRMANVVAARLLTTRLQLLDMFGAPPPEGSHG